MPSSHSRPAAGAMQVKVREVCRHMQAYMQARAFKGYDPYDALNSPLLRCLSFGTKYGRIAWTQLLRRLPVNVRPLLGIAKGHNPKSIALLLWGFAKLVKLHGDDTYRAQVNSLLDLLLRLRSRGYSGNCWGYNFPWQSRAFYLPRWTPTVVNTAFAGHALLDTYAWTQEQKALDMAMSTRDFMLHDLHRTPGKEGFCLSYTPLDKTAIHNANLLGASLLERLYQHNREERLRETALQCLAYSMHHQHADGSWYYAETHYQKWIDSFHTGFNLQAIHYFLNTGAGRHYAENFHRGAAFYAERFFLPDGTPKYYHNKVYPIDIHAPAQAVVFFSGMGGAYRVLTERIIAWMIDHMYNHKGYFYFRINPRGTNRIFYMRWSQAWAFHALTAYLLHSAGAFQDTSDA